MSVTVPRDMPEYRVDRDRVGVDAWVLCAEFVDRIISEAQEAAQRRGPEHPAAVIDVESIWRAGDGAPSDEIAIGRIVKAASVATRGLTESTTDAPAPNGAPPIVPPIVPSPGRGANGSSVAPAPEAAPQPAPPEGDAAASLVAPIAPPIAPIAEPPEAPAVTAAPAAPPIPAEPVAPAEVPPDAGLVTPLPETTAEPETTGEEDEAEPAGRRRVSTGRIFRNRPAWLTTFTWIEIIGAFIILFVGWQLWGTAISQAQDQNQLKSQFDNGLKTHHAPTPAAARGALIPASTHFGTPADGSVVAHIQIPTIGVDQYVVSGTTASDLSKGPGLYVGTALPGQAGNVAIAGHRTTHGAPFNRLGELKPGDKIVLTTSWGEHLTYVVSGTPVAVAPNDVAVLNYFGDNRITLTTCTPEYSSAQRLIAVGKLVDHKTTPLPPAGHVEYHIIDAGTASWNWALLPAVGVELSLLVLLGLSYRRIGTWFGRHGKWFVLVPVWAAGLYLLFDTLTTFLPDTI